jgi:ATPase
VEVIVPEAAVAELEALSNQGKDAGFSGLDELKKLSALARKERIKLTFAGERPTWDQIRGKWRGEVDELIRKVADERSALLLTSDFVQAEVARAKGIRVIHVERKPELPEFLRSKRNVYLTTGKPPLYRKGERWIPGGKKKFSDSEIRRMADEIVRAAKKDGTIQEREGTLIAEVSGRRIQIFRPPFSERIEIFSYIPRRYRLGRKLKMILLEKGGKLLAGPPGPEKSDFLEHIIRFLEKNGMIVRYPSKNIFSLPAPDYLVTQDLKLFKDFRISGMGCIGVVHASSVSSVVYLLDEKKLSKFVDTVIFLGRRVQKIYRVKLENGKTRLV